ncbi:uncharacterized protein LOC122249271 [Penaeus japonicus]|uniref:uncharacterized protein LOC122249271 n=1 Tax=Penaeus japonicus TaxID=27405 RepID=UPI001C712C52|nr:uncharacterized protein LOC122249271 [Penaeus japonicus]
MDKFPGQLKRALVDYPNTFCEKNGMAMLRPKFKICSLHTTQTGCLDHRVCSDVHICPDFVFDNCHNERCALGHNWHTNHNTRVNEALYLGGLTSEQLCRLTKRILGQNTSLS